MPRSRSENITLLSFINILFLHHMHARALIELLIQVIWIKRFYLLYTYNMLSSKLKSYRHVFLLECIDALYVLLDVIVLTKFYSSIGYPNLLSFHSARLNYYKTLDLCQNHNMKHRLLN